MRNLNLLTLLRGYYWTSLAMAILDAVTGVSLRATGLDAVPVLKWIYYGACGVCLWLVSTRHAVAFLVTFVESAVNIALLCLGILLPIWTAAGDAVGGVANGAPVTGRMVVNFLIAGAMAAFSFYGLSVKLPTKAGVASHVQ